MRPPPLSCLLLTNSLLICLLPGCGCENDQKMEERAAKAEPAPANLWGWGANKYGQVTQWPGEDVLAPVGIVGMSRIKAVAGGMDHSLALREDGLVWAWGNNEQCQLADGTAEQAAGRVKVDIPAEAVSVFAGGSAGLTLTGSGEVLWWGSYGPDTPTQVPDLADVTGIAAGSSHYLALCSDGLIRAWGMNAHGSLGDGTKNRRQNPALLDGLKNVRAVAASWNHSLALLEDGTVRAWGFNGAGQCVERNEQGPDEILRPIQVPGLTDVEAIAAGQSHSVALKKDGTIWLWGGFFMDAKIPGQEHGRRLVRIDGLVVIVAIASGYRHVLALREDGTVWAFGRNDHGQLGDGTTHERAVPVQIRGLPRIRAIAAGANHSFAIAGE